MQLVRGQKVGERLISRAVELDDGAEKEMIRELVRRLRVDNVDRIDALAGRLAIERDALEVHRLRQASARLIRDASRDVARAALIR